MIVCIVLFPIQLCYVYCSIIKTTDQFISINYLLLSINMIYIDIDHIYIYHSLLHNDQGASYKSVVIYVSNSYDIFVYLNKANVY